MHERRTLVVDELTAPQGAYSHAALFGALVFCAGQIGRDPDHDGELVAGAALQTRRALENVELICRAAGTTVRHALMMTVYVVDLESNSSAINSAIATFFGADPPARAMLGVSELPGGALVEIAAVAAIQSR